MEKQEVVIISGVLDWFLGKIFRSMLSDGYIIASEPISTVVKIEQLTQDIYYRKYAIGMKVATTPITNFRDADDLVMQVRNKVVSPNEVVDISNSEFDLLTSYIPKWRSYS